jgi:hypothetical protein
MEKLMIKCLHEWMNECMFKWMNKWTKKWTLNVHMNKKTKTELMNNWINK